MVTVTTKQHIIDKGNNVSNVQDFDSSEDFYSMEGDYSNSCGCIGIDGDYSNLDANSPKEHIEHFQKWINNKKGLNLTSGKWDEETAKLYLEKGISYDLIDNPNYVSNNPKPVTDLTNKYTLNKDLGNKDITKKGYYSKNFTFKPTPSTKYVPTDNAKDKKGMTKTTKILIGVGITLVLGTIIYFIAKKK